MESVEAVAEQSRLKVNVARTAGACFGVKRAIDMATENARDGKDVYLLGNIVHNEHVVKRLEGEGIRVVDEMQEVPDNATLMIRAHGTVPKTYSDAENRELEVVDATCPLVLEIHLLVRELQDEGYRIVIIGDHDHQEVKGIAGQVKDPIVIAHADEVAERMPRILKKAGVVVQSTQNIANVQAIVSNLVPRVHTLHVVNTICGPTKTHQNEIIKMPEHHDVMIVVGSFISANTKRLTSISRQLNPKTYQVETAEDIRLDWFKGAKSVGVSAGASTPDWLIDEVVEKLESIPVG